MLHEWQGRQGRLSYTKYLRSKLFDFIRQFLTLARVLPFGRFYRFLHTLQFERDANISVPVLPFAPEVS